MKSLVQYINEDLFRVNGIESDKLLIFDLDDTLIHSDANTKLKRNGKTIEMTPQDFNDYKYQPGDELDYTDFRSDRILDSAELTRYWKTLRREYGKGTHICILTARGDADMVYRFFKRKKITIKRELVIAVTDPIFGYTGSIPQRKQKAIESLITKGYKTFVFFDDSQANLDDAKSLEKKYDITVKTVKAE